jgi:hypothetical protein
MVRAMANGVEPTLFELQGYDGSRIVYTTTSVSGAPTFAYSGPLGDRSFTGEEIDRLDTDLGKEVTVVFERIADGDTTTVTLLVPPVEMGEQGTVDVETYAVVTTQAGGLPGPAAGQQYRYAVTAYSGPASAADF